MELRQLYYALKVAEERNFSRAAEKLHIAQPSRSQQILKLEKELDVSLFDRTTNSVELTYAGERFTEAAGRILDLTEQLKNEMRDISDVKKGKLVIGSMPMTGAHLLPIILPAFQAKYPGIEIHLVEETSRDLADLTFKGVTDISLLSLPLNEAEFEWIPVMEEEICMALPSAHFLATRHRIRLEELKDEPFILMKAGQGLHTMALNLCKNAGFVPKNVFESSNVETIQSLVAAGMGVAFVPRFVTRTVRSSFLPSYVPLDPPVNRTLVLAYRKGRYLSKAAKAFIHTVEEVASGE